MRWMLLAGVLAVSACNGGGSSQLRVVCGHVCQCEAIGRSAFDQKACVDDCSDTTGSQPQETPSKACLDCVQAATCDEIENGDACRNVCQPQSGS